MWKTISFAAVSSSVSCERSTCSCFSPSSSSAAAEFALVSASERGVPAREENTEDGTELGAEAPKLGASNDAPLLPPKPNRLPEGGGFAGVVENSAGEGVAGWNWKVGASFFFSVAGAPPNLIGLPTLKVWSPAKVLALGGAVLAPTLSKLKNANGLFVGVEVPFVEPKMDAGLSFSFSASVSLSSALVMRESRLPLVPLACFLLAASSESVSDSPNLRLGEADPVESTAWSFCDLSACSSSSSDSSWWVDEGPEERCPKRLFDDGLGAALGPSNTERPPIVEVAGLAARGVNKLGVDAPLVGLARLAKRFVDVVGLAVSLAGAGSAMAAGVVAPETLAELGRLKPLAEAIASFSLAIRSASSLS